MLAHLLSAKEVVLLYDPYQILLFFRGKVYQRPAKSGLSFLPMPPIGFYYPIWMMVHVIGLQVPSIPESLRFWLVQTSSLNPIQWSSWVKHNQAGLFGMSLWDMLELIAGYILACSSLSAIWWNLLTDCPFPSSLPLQHGYKSFREQLESQLIHKVPNPIWNNRIDAALEALQTEEVRVVELEAARVVADCDQGDSMEIDGETQSLPLAHSVDTTLVALVRNAVEEFGFAPRDVYGSVFNLPQMKVLS